MHTDEIPWKTAKEFYDIHGQSLFLGRKFYQVGMVGSAEEYAPYICRAAQIHIGDSVVDLGCGSGFMVNHIANETRAIGISNSEACVAAARKNYPQCEFHVQDMESLDQTDVDVCLSLESIGYADLSKTLQSVSMSLKPGGRFFVKDMVPFPSDNPKSQENLAYFRKYWKYTYTPQDETIQLARVHGLYLKSFTAYDESNVKDFLETLPLLEFQQSIPHPSVPSVRPVEFLFERAGYV